MCTPAAVSAIILRDLRAVRRQVSAYGTDDQLWQPVPGMANTAGTLALHLAGNLQHFIGARLGNTGYVRDRDGEFARRNVPRAVILDEIAAAERAVGDTLGRLGEDAMGREFPEPISGMRVPTGEYLVHLAVHLAYHLGQIDVHRRVVTGQTQGLDSVRPTELAGARPVGE